MFGCFCYSEEDEVDLLLNISSIDYAVGFIVKLKPLSETDFSFSKTCSRFLLFRCTPYYRLYCLGVLFIVFGFC